MIGFFITIILSIIAIIYFDKKFNEEKKKNEKRKFQAEQAKKREEERQLEINRLKKLDQQKKLHETEKREKLKREKEENKKKLDETERIDQLRRKKEEKYESVKIVEVGQSNGKYTCVLKRQNNTYANGENPDKAFQVNDLIKILKTKINDFDWITEKEYNKKKLDETERKDQLRREKEEKFESVKIVEVGQSNGKYTCVLKRQNNTYANGENPDKAFQVNDSIKILKTKINDFDWITETEYNKKKLDETERKDQLRREKEKKKLDQIKHVEDSAILAIKAKQKEFSEINTSYSNDLISLHLSNNNISFNNIRSLSVSYVNKLTKSHSDQLHYELNSGVKILETEAHLHKYIHAYGNMHQAKLLQSFSVIPNILSIINNKDVQINDYGCGQGIGSIVFIDFLKSINAQNYTISKITLLEPSKLALKRATLNVRYCLKSINQKENVFPIYKKIDDISFDDISTNSNSIKFHIFSNILDLENISIKSIYDKIAKTQNGVNYFICVSPKFWEDDVHPRNLQLDKFMLYFQKNYNVSVISTRESNINNWKRYERLFKVTM